MNAGRQKFCTEKIVEASGRMQFNEYLSIKRNSLNRFRIYKQFYKFGPKPELIPLNTSLTRVYILF